MMAKKSSNPIDKHVGNRVRMRRFIDPQSGRVVKKLKRAKDLGQRVAVDFWAATSLVQRAGRPVATLELFAGAAWAWVVASQ